MKPSRSSQCSPLVLSNVDSFRSQMLLLWQLLIQMLGLNFPCFRGNRVNIHGVSTDKAKVSEETLYISFGEIRNVRF